jgi:nucleoid DNA-binding protein
MEKKDFFHLIEQQGIAEPEAIDGLKRTVERIVRRLARGESVTLPGVGKLIPQVKQSIVFQAGSTKKKGARRGGR